MARFATGERSTALTRRLAAKPLTDPLLGCLVAVALYQLDHTRAPPFAIVDYAVANAASMVRPAAKALVNALLRRYLRERDALREALRADAVARWSYPRWWIDRVAREYPQDWQTILEAGNERPPLTLRVERRVTTRDALLARFAQAGIVATQIGAAGLIVQPPRPVAELPGFAEGAFSVQDAGAQLAAPLLASATGHASPRRLCRAGRQDDASRGARRRRDRRARRRRGEARPDPRECRAAPAWRGDHRGQDRRRGAALDVVGRPDVRLASSPTCRAPRRASCAGIRT